MINATHGTSTLSIFQRRINSAFDENKENVQNTKVESARGDVVEFNTKKLEIEAFTRGIKGANEFIGALQVADIALKKMAKEGENTVNEAQAAESLAKIDMLAQNSSFMGKKLFDRELTNEVNSTRFSLTLENPASMGNEMIRYIDSKRGEIASTLTNVSNAISSSSLVEDSGFNFEEFDPSAFKKLF
ncbi:MAG: flagellar FLiS export co-chaperone [Wolinella sp.]